MRIAFKQRARIEGHHTARDTARSFVGAGIRGKRILQMDGYGFLNLSKDFITRFRYFIIFARKPEDDPCDVGHSREMTSGHLSSRVATRGGCTWSRCVHDGAGRAKSWSGARHACSRKVDHLFMRHMIKTAKSRTAQRSGIDVSGRSWQGPCDTSRTFSTGKRHLQALRSFLRSSDPDAETRAAIRAIIRMIAQCSWQTIKYDVSI